MNVSKLCGEQGETAFAAGTNVAYEVNAECKFDRIFIPIRSLRAIEKNRIKVTLPVTRWWD